MPQYPSTLPSLEDERRIGWRFRLLLGMAGVVLILLLAVARTLTPDESGQGTHQQLGLPPCSIVTWFGMRCPACGMTTSWAAATRGDVMRALTANVGGTMYAIASVIAGPWMLLNAIRGRWFFTGGDTGWMQWTIVLLLPLVLVEWLVRLSL